MVAQDGPLKMNLGVLTPWKGLALKMSKNKYQKYSTYQFQVFFKKSKINNISTKHIKKKVMQLMIIVVKDSGSTLCSELNSNFGRSDVDSPRLFF